MIRLRLLRAAVWILKAVQWLGNYWPRLSMRLASRRS